MERRKELFQLLDLFWGANVPDKSHVGFVWPDLVAMNPLKGRLLLTFGYFDLVDGRGEFIADSIVACPMGKELPSQSFTPLRISDWLGEHAVPHLVPHLKFAAGRLFVIVGFLPFSTSAQVFLSKCERLLKMMVRVVHVLVCGVSGGNVCFARFVEQVEG